MGFVIEDSCLVLTHLLYKTALAFALLRWALSWAWRVRDIIERWYDNPATHPLSSPSSQMIKDNLGVTTYSDIAERLTRVSDSCAICLGPLIGPDHVRELRNCCHVYHRDCIDQWVDHDDDCDANHRSCPLCRAPLLASLEGLDLDQWNEPESEPSWPVERILYLFGDDLLF